MPAVSVIVPVYNAGRHLPRCVQSIQSQTMRDLEIILVDDGSTVWFRPALRRAGFCR